MRNIFQLSTKENFREKSNKLIQQELKKTLQAYLKEALISK
jgi:hypothetical protein